MAQYLKLILIRHGETDFALSGKYCGFTDVELNSNGIAQAHKIAKRLKPVDFDRVYSSDLLRSFQTATVVFDQSKIIKRTELREMNFGIIEGLSHQEALEQHREIYQKWLRFFLPREAYDLTHFTMPGAENLIDLQSRVKRFTNEIREIQEDSTIGVVTHAGPIKLILCDALGIEPAGFWRIKQELGAVNVMEYYDNNTIVCCINDICHLRAD